MTTRTTILTSLAFISIASLSTRTSAQDSAKVAGKELPSVLVRAADAVPTRGEWGGWLRYFRGDTPAATDMVVLAVTLKPGQEPHPPHKHAEEEFLILAEGEGQWHLDGKDYPARKGDVVYARPWAMHGVKNTGTAPLTYYMLKYGGKAAQPSVPDNVLTDSENKSGWQLLFDGRTHAGWMNSDRTAPRTPVADGALNPHKAGAYMLVHEKQWGDFVLALDFKLSKGCNSGIFIRTSPLDPRPGKDVGFNGLEIALDDTNTAGLHDTGALYDLIPPTRNAMKPIGEWNHIEITARGAIIEVVLNRERVMHTDLDQFTEKNKRPDGTAHKFDVAYREHPRTGYIGLQDHGSPCWFRNIKLRPL